MTGDGFIQANKGYSYEITDYDLKVNLDKTGHCGRALEFPWIQEPVVAQWVKKVIVAVMGAKCYSGLCKAFSKAGLIIYVLRMITSSIGKLINIRMITIVSYNRIVSDFIGNLE